MELQHFSHDHPLILTSQEKNDDGEEIVCKGCQQSITGLAYNCKNCLFFLHKSCAELPTEMKHSMHPEHPLTLLSQAPYPFGFIFKCDACHQGSTAFTYHCSLCNFDLDLVCAFKVLSVEHKSHQHPLSPLFSPASFDCLACRTKREGVSYLCNTCRFWIHEDCASLPVTFKHSNHIHPLTLAYYFPVTYLGCSCNVCEEELNLNSWIYHCDGCKYVVDVNCSKKTKEGKTPIMPEEYVDEANLIHLPVLDELFRPITQFVKQISRGSNKREAKLSHSSHDHPLTLVNAHSDNDLCFGSQVSDLNEQSNSKICDGCVQPISAPFYSCSECNFFLHNWCVVLLNELLHFSHPHPLILDTKVSEHFGFFDCVGCGNICNGFSFQCVEPECKDYYLDIKCASFPSSIVHEVHEHPLFLRKDCVTEGCAACDQRVEIFSFGCGICNFNLHYTCALLPRTIKHRFDKHPFILTYGPIKDGPDEYVCEFCEEDINPSWWFYHCIDCDQSACANCIYKEEKEYPNIKSGSSYNFDSHPHPLTLVELMNKNTLCDACNGKIFFHGFAFKCAQCNIMLHLFCACPALLEL